jgi:hypothetical protein
LRHPEVAYIIDCAGKRYVRHNFLVTGNLADYIRIVGGFKQYEGRFFVISRMKREEELR